MMGIHTLNVMCVNKTEENILKLRDEKLILFLINFDLEPLQSYSVKELLCSLPHLVFIESVH